MRSEKKVSPKTWTAIKAVIRYVRDTVWATGKNLLPGYIMHIKKEAPESVRLWGL